MNSEEYFVSLIKIISLLKEYAFGVDTMHIRLVTFN